MDVKKENVEVDEKSGDGERGKVKEERIGGVARPCHIHLIFFY